MKEREQADNQYMLEKHRILQELEESEEEDNGSVDFTTNTQNWLDNHIKTNQNSVNYNAASNTQNMFHADPVCASTSTMSQPIFIPSVAAPVNNVSCVVSSALPPILPSYSYPTFSPWIGYNSNSQQISTTNTTAGIVSSMPTTLAPPLPTSYANPAYSSSSFNITSQPFSAVPMACMQNGIVESTNLTANNFAARQVLPRDLPNFSGKVEEWPLFISTYESSTRMCGFSNEENLVRLQRSLKDKALEAVSCRLLMASMVPDVIATLKMLFGRPEVIIHSLLEKIRREPPPRSDNLEHLIRFSLSVQSLCATIEASGLSEHLCNPSLIQELVDKLPSQIKLNWALHRQSLSFINISTFSNWLCHLAQAASSVTMPSLTCYTAAPDRSRSTKTRGFLNVHGNLTTENESTNELECPVCEGNHLVSDCNTFKTLSRSGKWNTVSRYRLCRRCLSTHRESQCSSYKECGRNGCTLLHHPLLHNDKRNNNTTQQASSIADLPQSNNDSQTVTDEQFSSNTHHKSHQSVLFRIIPVKLYNNDISVETYAFIDEGSSLTLLEESISNDLGLDGTPDSLCLRWTADASRTEPSSKRISLQISGQYQDAKKYKISDVRTVNKLNLPVQSVALKEMCHKYSHLLNAPIQSYEEAVPRILIGLDNGRIILPLEVKEGKINEPVATRTRLGWTIHGHLGNPQKTSDKDGHYNYHICDCNINKLHSLVKEFFSLENFGVKKPEIILEPKEDTRAKNILKETTVRLNNKFETGLLWKFDCITFPDSFPMAKRRLLCLEKRMSRDPQLAKTIQGQIRDYLLKGYARKLTRYELAIKSSRIWYLPIFSVTNHNKPSKVRLVWDAAATVNNISLNSMLLKGPDQLSSLPGILQRFREKKIAICGDISEMFHQVLIRQEDQNSQRFIWRDNPEDPPEIYVMNVMTFGASCSPSSAQYVKNINASEYSETYPRAVLAIHNNHYVDDFLDSVSTPEEAIQLANEVRFIHKQGGFHIRNWISNSKQFIEAMDAVVPKYVKNMNINSETVAAEKVLGMWWFPDSDTFSYSLQYNTLNKEVLSGLKRPTKREVLRTLMSIYDPLGFIAFLLVIVKILLQDIWRTSIEWDDPLTDKLFEKWSMWIKMLPMVETVRVPRCYMSEVQFDKLKSTQLHVFVDASENAYAAVAYFRFEDDMNVECALIGAKTKVAPQKPLTIPRLELQAATLGARLANSICQNQSFAINKRFLWSDSKTVLAWLRSDQRKYKQFVAFRIGEILETTELSEWRWIPTKFNVADEATKWQNTPTFNTDNRWFSGPSFLRLPIDQWPIETSNTSADFPNTNEELRPNFICAHRQESNFQMEVARFSKWSRLYRALAYVLRFVNNIKARIHKSNNQIIQGPLMSNELNVSQNMLFRQAQQDCYTEEIAIIMHNKNSPPDDIQTLPKSCPIRCFSPYLDENNMLRVHGRIDAAYCVDESMKRPILLPRKHPITLLIADSYHRLYKHINQETVVNEIRQKFCIPSIRVLVKKVKYLCQLCKNKSALPQQPEMGQLPTARLSSFTRPFSYVGVDYFGPMLVSVGRRQEKRWGVLFTCMTVRAIHIEIAHSLTTDSCIMCIRNFIARRGTPLEFHSDNGTNFHGANNELSKEMSELQKDKLIEEFTTVNTKWIYNPPASPHMGGSWERLVASVKKCLCQIMPERNPRDEVFLNLMLEVENIINSRPLTYVSIEETCNEALTPNHFLLGSSNGSKPPCCSRDRDQLTRNWKTAQYLANAFWKRWVKEYLPTLTRRSKWFDKVNPIKNNDIVVIVDDTMPRNSWPMGKVIETMPGKDGQVRSAMVQTSSGCIYHRPSVKLAVLDVKRDTENVKQSTGDNLPGGQC